MGTFVVEEFVFVDVVDAVVVVIGVVVAFVVDEDAVVVVVVAVANCTFSCVVGSTIANGFL